MTSKMSRRTKKIMEMACCINKTEINVLSNVIVTPVCNIASENLEVVPEPCSDVISDVTSSINDGVPINTSHRESFQNQESVTVSKVFIT